MIILASQSEIRRALLTAAGITFTSTRSTVDEKALQSRLRAVTPNDMARKLANAKALPVSIQNPDAFVIGVDQTLEFEGSILHKPSTIAEAQYQLQRLRGKNHLLHTAYSVVQGKVETAAHCQTSTITMRHFSDHFLNSYLDNSPATILSSVGCYQFEGQGVQLIHNTDGDYFSILGLPLLSLLEHLRQLGALPS